MILRTRQLNRRQPVFWIAGAFFAACAVWGWLDGQHGAALVLALMAVLSGLALWPSTEITLDEQGITWHGRLGRQHIAWSEIRRIDTDDVTLVLWGENKKFPVAPRFWAPDGRAAAEDFLRARLAQLGVPETFNPVASDAVFRNTRVGGFASGPQVTASRATGRPPPRIVRLYQALSWLPPAALVGALVSVSRQEGWAAHAVAGSLGPLVLGFSVLLGLGGVVLCAWERSRGRPVGRLVLATLLAGSVALLFLARLIYLAAARGG